MKKHLWKVIVIIGVIVIGISLIDFAIEMNKIRNHESHPFFVNLRNYIVENGSPEEIYIEETLPVAQSMARHNTKVTVRYRIITTVLATIIGVEFTKPKRYKTDDSVYVPYDDIDKFVE